MQFFKDSDLKERKFYDVGDPLISAFESAHNDFFEGAYECFLLGDALYNSKSAPLTNAIAQDIFRTSFFSIFDNFLLSGSFESYLDVFAKIFGPEVEVEFTVPSPGKLNIDIVATGLDIFGFGLKVIEGSNFVFHTLVDDESDRIVFQSFKGFESQFELERLLFEMVPHGVYTEITLEIGGA